MQKCKFLISQALDADEAGLKDIAIKLYTDAVELGLSAKLVILLLTVITISIKLIFMVDLHNILQKSIDPEEKAKLTNLARGAVERAESLKGIRTVEDDVLTKLAKLPSVPETNFPDTISSVNEPLSTSGNNYSITI